MASQTYAQFAKTVSGITGKKYTEKDVSTAAKKLSSGGGSSNNTTTTGPQYSPSAGIGAKDSGYTYTKNGWVQDSKADTGVIGTSALGIKTGGVTTPSGAGSTTVGAGQSIGQTPGATPYSITAGPVEGPATNPIVQTSGAATQYLTQAGKFIDATVQSLTAQQQLAWSAAEKTLASANATEEQKSQARLEEQKILNETTKINSLTSTPTPAYTGKTDADFIAYLAKNGIIQNDAGTIAKANNVLSTAGTATPPVTTTPPPYTGKTDSEFIKYLSDIGVISPDKVNAANDYLKSLGATPPIVPGPKVDETKKEPTKTPLELKQEKQLEENAEALEEFQDMINKMRTGTFPLNTLQQAQLDSLEKNYTSLIEQQTVANKAQQGAVIQEGIMSGLSRYAPGQATADIAAAVKAGITAIAELDSKMTGDLAKMNSGFQSDNYGLMKESYTAFKDNQKLKQDQLDKLQDQMLEALKATNLANEKALAEFNATKTDILIAAKQNGAPPEVIAAINAATTVAEMVDAGGDYLASTTGLTGEYVFYKNQAEQNGLAYMTYDEWRTQDENRKIKLAQAANAAGLTGALTNVALKLSDDYKADSKDFYVTRDAYNRVMDSSKDPSAAGDLALIFNYMKTLDPGSTVREGEFATAQNSGSAWDIVGALYNKVLYGKRLTQKQRDDFVDRATKIFNGALKQQTVVKSEHDYRATSLGIPTYLVTRSIDATSAVDEVIMTENSAKTKTFDAVVDNPELQATIDNWISLNYTYLDIYDLLVDQGLIKK